MKKLIVVVMLVAMVGCATYRLPDNATPEQIQAANCADARAWLNMAVAGMSAAPVDSDLYKYWAAGRPTAQAAVDSYCPPAVK